MPGLRYGLAAAAAIGFVSIASTAGAQSVVVREYNSVVIDDYDGDDFNDAVEIYQEDGPAVVEVSPPETRVYGWAASRPYPNCGRMHYWNGVRCLDARFDPPFAE